MNRLYETQKQPCRLALRIAADFAIIVFLILIGTTSVLAGAFDFAGESNGVDSITHVFGYDGTGEHLIVTVGIDSTSANADAMVIPVQNMIKVINALRGKNQTLISGGANNIPSGKMDFESVALHELGHALGLAHTNLGGSGAQQDYTNTTDGANNTYEIGIGADGVVGSSDDSRGDDVNLNWFRISNNNPFTADDPIDTITYARDTAMLPSGHAFSANAGRDVGSLLGESNSEAIMNQGSYYDEAQRELGIDDAAMFRLAMAGEDETAGTSDDYTFELQYAGKTTSADIVLDFDNTTGFASTGFSATVLATNHYAITTANMYFNTGFDWFFNTLEANAPPVIDSQAVLSTPEETALAIALDDLNVSDPDNTYPADFTLSVQNGTDYSRVGNTITPDTDFNGTLTVPVTVNDGTDDSDPFYLDVSVTPVNDKPVITGQDPLSTPEETQLTITLNDLTVSDPDDSYPADFTLSVQNGANYSRSGNAITPSTEFNGTLTVPVTVNDGSVSSDSFNLSVSVTAVNDKPVITGQASLSTPEDTQLTITLNDLTVSDPDNTYPADFTLSVQNGTNYSRSGNAITPSANFTGTLTVPATVNDGTTSSDPFDLSVSVTAVNDKPVITGQKTLVTEKEIGITIFLSDITVTDPDNTYPAGFTLSVQNGANYSHTGNTITPAMGFVGTLSVPIIVNDGALDSDSYNLAVRVTVYAYVDKSGGGCGSMPLCFTSITDAIDDSDVLDGYTINVPYYASGYIETVDLNKNIYLEIGYETDYETISSDSVLIDGSGGITVTVQDGTLILLNTTLE